MRVLIYDNDTANKDRLILALQSLPLKITSETCESYQDFSESFSASKYKVLFIDINNDTGKKIVTSVLEQSSQQKIVLFNNDYTCIGNKDCLQCTSLYDMTSMIKPVGLHQLVHVFNGSFKCESYAVNELQYNILKIEKIVNERYPLVEFCKERNIFSISTYNAFGMRVMYNIAELLQNDNIKYKMLDSYELKVICDD